MNIPLDTSVRIRHCRTSTPEVVRLLEAKVVVSHEFVVGALACSSLKSRQEIIRYLKELVTLPNLSVEEILMLVELRAV